LSRFAASGCNRSNGRGRDRTLCLLPIRPIYPFDTKEISNDNVNTLKSEYLQESENQCNEPLQSKVDFQAC
jgi:hypothetical protein